MHCHRLLSLVLACWLCLIPSLARADSVNTVVGISGKDTDAVTWRHLLSARFSQFSAGAYTTAANQNYLATYSLTAGCSGVLCGTISAASVLAVNADQILPGNQSLLALAHTYGLDYTTGNWNRLRIQAASINTPTATAQSGLAIIPMMRSGYTPSDQGLGDGITQAVQTGVQNMLTYGVSTGGALNRTYQAGFIGVTPNTCAGCQIAANFVLVDPAAPAWRAWAGQPVQGTGTLTNSQTASTADTAVSVTLAAAVNNRSHVYKVTGRCSTGTSNLAITHGGTTVWSTGATEVGTVNFREEWATGLTGPVNSAAVITLAACGAGNTGTLMVQSDVF